MSQGYSIGPNTAGDILREAVADHTPAVITCKASSGWVMFKSCFLGASSEDDWLLVELGPAETAGGELPQAGENIGVSFRRGHRKCIFNSTLLEAIDAADRGRKVTALRLAWPDDVQELQRRLYHRTQVPSGRLIPVDLWTQEAGGEPSQLPQRGKMLDLSAGGMNVELSRELRPRIREQDQLSCRFQTDSGHPPVEIVTRLTHYSRQTDGHVRLGLQFVGLDACEHGRHILRQISHMANRLQHHRSTDGRPWH